MLAMDKRVPAHGEEIIRLNVGGTTFQCYEYTLKTFPESLLARIACVKDAYIEATNEYFFDRNALIFTYILDACRKGTIHLPKDMCGATFKEELEFWQLSPSHVAPCCWEALYNSDEEMSKMNTLVKNLKQNTNDCLLMQEKFNLKQKIWLFLDEPSSSKYAMLWGAFISTLIIASTVTEGLATLPGFMVNFTADEMQVIENIGKMLGWANTSVESVKEMKPHPALVTVDTGIHIVLTFDLVLSFIVCPQKRFYATSVMRMVVLIGYLSFWIALAMEFNLASLKNIHELRAYTALKYIAILKLCRLFYLTKRVPAFNIMALTFRTSFKELKILAFLLAILVSGFGFIMYFVEFFHPSNISNIFAAMYWALITLTTVGYGHYIPESTLGHVIAAICAVCGVIVLALPIGIIASTFYTYYNYHTYARNHVHLYGKQLCGTATNPRL